MSRCDAIILGICDEKIKVYLFELILTFTAALVCYALKESFKTIFGKTF